MFICYYLVLPSEIFTICTLTYFPTENGYQVFFNRDEQKSRVNAIAPRFDKNLSAIFPLDPQGDGTWIAVSNKGITLALLNNYQASELSSKQLNTFQPINSPLKLNEVFISRGQIIKTLLHHLAIDKVPTEQDLPYLKNLLSTMLLKQYQPFTLCMFSSIYKNNLNYAEKDDAVVIAQWNGELLSFEAPTKVITSSGKNIISVTKARNNLYQETVKGITPTSELHKDYHLNQQAPTCHSVNMNREDAQTVSFSHISVEHEIKFSYLDLVYSTSVDISNERLS